MSVAPPPVVLKLAQTRILPVAERPGFAVGVAILLQRFWRWVGTPARVLFPADAPAGPPRITPGSAIELHVDASASGRRSLHVYAESTATLGSAQLKLSLPQVVALDARGHGRAVIRAVPKQASDSGRVELRVVAVADDAPDNVAAEITGIKATVAGTGGVVAAAIGAAFLIGFVAELWLREWPILAVLALGALGSIFLSRPKEPLRFRPSALLPLGRRLRLAGAAVGGLALWIGLMWVGLDGAAPFDPWCGDPGTDDCVPADVLVDNLTSIGAALALFGLVALALTPALRPRLAGGQAMLVCAAMVVLLYDLTLLPGSGDAAQLAKLFVAGFGSIGWILGAFGLVVLQLGWRASSWRGTVVLLVTGLVALPAMVGYGAFLDNPMPENVASLAFVALVASLARRALTPALGWRWLREVVFWLVLGLCLFLIGGSLDSNNPSERQMRMALPVLICAIGALWTLGEVALWRRRRRSKASADTEPAGDAVQTDAPAGT